MGAVAGIVVIGSTFASRGRQKPPRTRSVVPMETATNGDLVVPGRVLLRLNRPLRPEVRDYLQHFGVSLEGVLDGGVEVVAVPVAAPADLIAECFRAIEEVEFCEPDTIVTTDIVPGDPEFVHQWHLTKIRAPEAWNTSSGASTTVIAVLDTGVDGSHPDLTGKLSPGYNFISNNTNTTDDNGHGTHVAGIAAASTDNSLGIAGVGYRCSIMPVKVLDASGTGSYSTIAAGISYASRNGAKVLNLSLSGATPSLSLEAAVNAAIGRGCVVVAAAGNSGVTTEAWPAACSGSIAVAASTPADARASFSNYGTWVDLAAPGTSLLSTFPLATVTLGTAPSGYKNMSGTSMATPVVAGVAGLLYSYLGNQATPANVRSILESTANPIARNFTVHGRVDAAAALLEAVSPVGPRVGTPRNIAIKVGRWKAGDVSSITSVNQMAFETMAAGPRNRREAGVEIDVDGLTGTLSTLQVEVTSAATVFARQNIAIYNWARSRYDVVHTTDVRPVAASSKLDLSSSASSYVRAGTLRMRVTQSANTGFTGSIDCVEASAMGR